MLKIKILEFSNIYNNAGLDWSKLSLIKKRVISAPVIIIVKKAELYRVNLDLIEPRRRNPPARD